MNNPEKIRTPYSYRGANLNVEDIKLLSEEIYDLVHGDEPMTIPEYIEKAKSLKKEDLGYRKLKAIHAEPEISMYFPDEVLDALKALDHENINFNQSDYDFLSKNKNLGLERLSELFYSDVKYIQDQCHKVGIKMSIHRPKTTFTDDQDLILKNNAFRGYKWLCEKIGKSQKTIKRRADQIGVEVKHVTKFDYTLEEDGVIQNFAYLGDKYLAKRLGRSERSVRARAREINVKLKVVKNFTPEQDEIIKKYSNRGAKFIAKKIGKNENSVKYRAKQIRVKLVSEYGSAHGYSGYEDYVLKSRCNMGYSYLCKKLNKSKKSISKRADFLGVKINERESYLISSYW